MANLREIAKLAGVSKSTVSLVINDSPLVKQETKEKVQAVIRQMKYVPNTNARNLSRNIMNSLGIIVLSDLRRSRSYDYYNGTGLFSLNVIQGITSALADTEYSVIIEYFHVTDIENENEMPKLIRDRKIDGAFIVGGYCEKRFIDRLQETGIPFVTIVVGKNSCDCVSSDPAEGAYMSVRHLMETGHQNIGFINCPVSFRSSAQREQGIRRLSQETGGAFRLKNMLHTEHNNGASGYESMRQAWLDGVRFDGIATANPQIAMGAMRFLQEQGVRVPEDVSIIAYEDNSICGYSNPPLTAVNIQKELMGEEAARLLLARIADPLRPYQTVPVEMHLVFRSSVKDRERR